ncbi:hypothetical protein ACIBG6_34510 [Streptomyces sp. NPDC050842]|uniref:hypothetical protein n=1 Tax=Streptomyces sp. NPDC050842 TaxID=3365636 RepID=UPI00379C70BC
MDVEEVAEELYGLKPAEFVAARDAYVAEARKVKDAAAAKAIAALRRPALAAWAANLLARERRREAEQFLTVGDTLREAHRTLDAQQLRVASRQRHQLVTALARTAADLAREAGQPVSDTVLHEIEQTLQGVLADQGVAERWSKGRLVRVPEATVGFAAVAPEAESAHPDPAERPEPKKKPGREAERRLRDLERARTKAEEADAEVGKRERELGDARDAQEAAGAKAEEAEARVVRMEHELQAARKAKTKSGVLVTEAGTAVKAAESALREARRVAERAVRAVERLEVQGEP